LKWTSKSWGDFFFFFNKRIDDLMKDMFEGNFKNLEGFFFFFNKRLDDLMKDLFEGNFKNL